MSLGILVDKPTLLRYEKVLLDDNELVRSYRNYDGESLSYGMIVTNQVVFDYINGFVKENRLVLETCVTARLTVETKVSNLFNDFESSLNTSYCTSVVGMKDSRTVPRPDISPPFFTFLFLL